MSSIQTGAGVIVQLGMHVEDADVETFALDMEEALGLLAYVESLETRLRHLETAERIREINRQRERARREKETPEQAAERRRKNAERARARRLKKDETV